MTMPNKCITCNKIRVDGRVRCQSCLDNNSKSKRKMTSELREAAFAVYGGDNYCCVCCGESNRYFLELDHINNDGSYHRKIHGKGLAYYRWLRDNNYPKGLLQILCANCNKGKAKNNGVCPHNGALRSLNCCAERREMGENP